MDRNFIPFKSSQITTVRRRNLPHWEQPKATYFITFRTKDSLARSTLVKLEKQRKLWILTHPRPWSATTSEEYNQMFFSLLDRQLDDGFGACHLRDPAISKIVAKAVFHFDGIRYVLDDFVVMPNHVHTLVKPLENDTLSGILHSWKSYTAQLINQRLGLKGSFWMPESFDRIVRSWNDLLQTRNYIRENPIKARLKPGEFQIGRGIGIEDLITTTGRMPDIRSGKDA